MKKCKMIFIKLLEVVKVKLNQARQKLLYLQLKQESIFHFNIHM